MKYNLVSIDSNQVFNKKLRYCSRKYIALFILQLSRKRCSRDGIVRNSSCGNSGG